MNRFNRGIDFADFFFFFFFFAIVGFHCHAIENENQNRSLDKVQNLGNERRKI